MRQALSDKATAQETAETIAATSPIVTDANGNSAPRMDLYLTYEDMSASGPPSAPTIVRIDYGDGEIYLTFQVDKEGGSPVTLVTATCTDGINEFVATNSSSPITVSGLSNGTSYICTVTATNSLGTSPASAATDSITPDEQVSGGLPIWLLYKATQ